VNCQKTMISQFSRWLALASMTTAGILLATSGCHKKSKHKIKVLTRSRSEAQAARDRKSRAQARASHQADARQHAAPKRIRGKERITILSLGQGPKRALRYHLNDGMVIRYRGDIHQVTAAPDPIGSFEAKYEFELVQSVHAASGRDEASRNGRSENGTDVQGGKDAKNGSKHAAKKPGKRNGGSIADKAMSVDYALEHISIGLPKRLKLNTTLMDRTLSGLHFQTTLFPNGSMTDFRATGDLPRPIAADLKDLAHTLATLHPRLPNNPVGKGASWKLTSWFQLSAHLSSADTNIDTTIETTYHLIGFKHSKWGPVASLSFTVQVTGRNRSKTLPIVAIGKGKGVLDLVLPYCIPLSHQGSTTVTTKVQDNESSNTTIIHVNLQSLKGAQIPAGSVGNVKHKKTRK